MALPKFRETLWFKRGEETEGDTVPLPVEDRYLDDGTVSPGDTEAFGLHTGTTQPIANVREDTTQPIANVRDAVESASSERPTKRIKIRKSARVIKRGSA